MSSLAATDWPAPGSSLEPPTRTKTRVGLLLAGLGSLGIGLATVGLTAIREPPDVMPPMPRLATTESRPESGGLHRDDISVLRITYDPGVSSGWHTHSGLHAVAVLSGTLTVYDAQCRRNTFGPDHPYIGGQEVHLAQNETASPVEMVVTFVDMVAMAATGTTSPAVDPPPCATQR